MLTQVRTNPVSAGMFVYGRRVQQTRAGDPPHRFAQRLPEEEWEIVVSGVSPAYITEEQYARTREQLRANLYNFLHHHPGAPREGTALVQGLVLCGRCGRRRPRPLQQAESSLRLSGRRHALCDFHLPILWPTLPG
jgi:hypothetical protein